MPPIPGPGGGLADGRYRDITSHGSRDTATISLDVMLRTLKLKNRLKFYFYHHHKASIRQEEERVRDWKLRALDPRQLLLSLLIRTVTGGMRR